MTRARMPCSRSSCPAISFNLPSLRETSTRSIQSAAKNRANSSPSPCEAPVIKAVCFCSVTGSGYIADQRPARRPFREPLEEPLGRGFRDPAQPLAGRAQGQAVARGLDQGELGGVHGL